MANAHRLMNRLENQAILGMIMEANSQGLGRAGAILTNALVAGWESGCESRQQTDRLR